MIVKWLLAAKQVMKFYHHETRAAFKFATTKSVNQTISWNIWSILLPV